MHRTMTAPGAPATAATRVGPTGLLDWMDDPTEGRGFHFAEDDGSWTFWDYSRLASLVAEAAERIEAERTRDDGPISIAIPSGPNFVAAFLGALVAGHTPSPLALPIFLRDPDRYVRHVAAILEVADPALVLAEPGLVDQLSNAAELAGLSAPPKTLELTGEPVTPLRRTPAELALLQFTSGSSGRPRGVRVTWENLELNCEMIRRWSGLGPGGSVATWLPMYHDMGLIGCLLSPIVGQNDVWLMRPDQFIRDPLRWLELFGKHGAHFGVAPNFGFAYANRRISDEQLEGMDFSQWETAVVAAERIDPDVVTKFAKRLEPYGFKAKTFAPAYGLAEATLAVTGVDKHGWALAVRPRWSEMRFGEQVTIEETAKIGDEGRFASGAGWLVSCGRALPGVTVAIVDDDGRELPEAHLGEIKVVGDTVALGYTVDSTSSSRFTDDGLLTGDAGLIVNGDLYVLGRLGDSMKVRGRTVFVEDVEAQIAAADGVSKGKVVVLAGVDGERSVLAAVVEATRGAWVHEVSRILEAEVGNDASIKVVASPPQTIQRTSSGKPRRRIMWKEFIDGTVPGEVVFSTVEDTPAASGSDTILARGIADEAIETYRERVRREIDRSVTPFAARAEERREFPAEAVRLLGQADVFRERWDGGDHGDAGKGVLLSEELGRALAGGVGVGISVHLEAVLSMLRRYGETDALRDLYEQAIDGRQIGCVAASERAHGSDLASVETVAMRERDGWRINGEKRYVSVGAAADFALVLAREHDAATDTPLPALTLFAVPAQKLEVTERLQGMGMRALETVTLAIDTWVSDAMVLGRPGRGLHVMMWGLTHERLASAAQTLGAASLAIDLATTHARRRVQFGQRLISHQAIRARLGDLASQVWLARAGVYALAGSLNDARPETARHVAAAKVTSARLAEHVISECMQVLGGRGYLEDASPLAQMYRDIRFARIGGGTDEMMWELVAAGLQGSDELYERMVRTAA